MPVTDCDYSTWVWWVRRWWSKWTDGRSFQGALQMYRRSKCRWEAADHQHNSVKEKSKTAAAQWAAPMTHIYRAGGSNPNFTVSVMNLYLPPVSYGCSLILQAVQRYVVRLIRNSKLPLACMCPVIDWHLSQGVPQLHGLWFMRTGFRPPVTTDCVLRKSDSKMDEWNKKSAGLSWKKNLFLNDVLRSRFAIFSLIMSATHTFTHKISSQSQLPWLLRYVCAIRRYQLTVDSGRKAEACERKERGSPPLHDDEEAFLAMVHVLIEAEDLHDVGAPWHPPVQLHLSPRLWAIVQNLWKEQF